MMRLLPKVQNVTGQTVAYMRLMRYSLYGTKLQKVLQLQNIVSYEHKQIS